MQYGWDLTSCRLDILSLDIAQEMTNYLEDKLVINGKRFLSCLPTPPVFRRVRYTHVLKFRQEPAGHPELS